MLGIRRRIKRALKGTQQQDAVAAPQSVASRQVVVESKPVSSAGNFTAAARAVSEGKAPLTPVVTPVVNMSEAGFWGPVDNESARDRAAGKELEIDRNECIGCGTCVENTEEVFYLNDDECKAYVIAQEGDMELVQDAIDACPVTCISWR